MYYNPRLHSFPLLLKSVMGRLELLRGGLRYPSGELLVLNYHGTPRKHLSSFRAQLRFLHDHFSFITPSDLAAYFSGTLETPKCKVLITFDDGLKNNLYAVDALNAAGIKACFFVVPAFIDTPVGEQASYYVSNIRPVVNTRVDSQPEDYTAMTWEDLKLLARQGHTIGAHTFTHTLVAAQSGGERSLKEVLGCKTKIESVLQQPVQAFCSINDTLRSVGAKEKKLIAEHYSYHFTTLPGLNAQRKDPQFIMRRNVECFWPTGAFLFAMGKFDLGRWEPRRRAYEKL